LYQAVRETLILKLSKVNAKRYIKNAIGVKIKDFEYQKALEFVESKQFLEERLERHIQFDLVFEHFDRYDNLKTVIDVLNRSILMYSQPDNYDGYLIQKLAETLNSITKTMVAMNLSSPVYAKMKYDLEMAQNIDKPVPDPNIIEPRAPEPRRELPETETTVEGKPTEADQLPAGSSEDVSVSNYTTTTDGVLQGDSEPAVKQYEHLIQRGREIDAGEEIDVTTDLQRNDNSIEGSDEQSILVDRSLSGEQAQGSGEEVSNGTDNPPSGGTEEPKRKLDTRTTKTTSDDFNKRGNKSSQRVF
jgi:hypothetical protein